MAKKTAAPADASAAKLDFKRLLPIFVIVFVDLLGLTIILPLLPLYASAFGASPTLIGALGAVYPLMQFIGAPLLGALSDRVGRKPVLIVSQLGTFIGFILLGLANAMPLLFVSRFIDGLSGANISTAQTVISDSTDEKTRTQAMGMVGAAFGLGFTIGPLITFIALSLSGNNYHIPAFIAAGFSLLSIILTATWLKETRPTTIVTAAKRQTGVASMFAALGSPQVGFLLALMFAQQAVFFTFEQLFPLFTVGRMGLGASGNSMLFLFVGVISVVVQGGLVRVWSHKYGDKWLITMGLITLSVGLLLFALTPGQVLPSYDRAALLKELSGQASAASTIVIPDGSSRGWLGMVWILVALIPASVGGSVLGPTINSMISKRGDQSQTGQLLGTSAAFSSAANAIGPLLGGALFQFLGAGAPFMVGTAILGGLYFLARKRV